MWRYLCFCAIFCAVIEINCWSGDSDGYRSSEYARNKRAKYYSIPSHKYYGRPSYTYSNRSPFTYSSPHGYTANDIGLASKQKPYKVSKIPFNEGLGDDDFNNLIKYLSHKDLDKIVKFAAEKERNLDNYRDLDNYEYKGDFDSEEFRNIDYEEDNPDSNDPNIQFYYKYNNIIKHRPSINYPQMQTNMNMYTQTPIKTGEEPELSLLDGYIQKEINVMNDRNYIFTDSSTWKEEELPKPINLREDDYDVSSTNNVRSFAKPESSYQLGNFADLPLMDYEHSKLERVNSYSVPYYSVSTRNSKFVLSSSNHRPRYPSPAPLPPSQLSSSPVSSSISLTNALEVEPAPPASAAKEQSDAHLKAIKIWTHKSKGTAYTLHDDGTLSLEQPSQPRYKYP
ncbi:uncharacterized protein [Maniola hyperantus]|uniref:uncharacterized protein n=1 Tax=Aphantopus hyperantus TaxID=2795564 RepID=UPI003749B4E2